MFAKFMSVLDGLKTQASPPPEQKTSSDATVQSTPSGSPRMTAQASTPAPSSLIPPPPPSGTPTSNTPPVYGKASGSAQQGAQQQFLQAVKDGDFDTVKTLLLTQANAIDVTQLDPDTGMSPLRHALDAKNDKLAQLLIATGKAPVNAETPGGLTPLMLASKEGLLKTTKSLLRRGAELDDTDKFKKTALFHTCENKTENVDLVQALLDAGADVNKKDTLGRTPLLIACQNGHLDVARMLLKKGAQINEADTGGDTPLMQACKADANKAAAMVKLLLDNGALLDCCNKQGNTPVITAVNYKNELALIELLARFNGTPAELDAYLDRPNNKGETARTIVRARPFDRIETLLIKNGAT